MVIGSHEGFLLSNDSIIKWGNDMNIGCIANASRKAAECINELLKTVGPEKPM